MIDFLLKKKKHFESGYKEKEPKDNDDEDDEKTEKKTKVKLNNSEKDFDYLLGMKMWNLTWERVEELKKQRENAKKELDALMATGPEDLWIRDLDIFVKAWNDFSSQMDYLDKNPTTKGKGKKKQKCRMAIFEV